MFKKLILWLAEWKRKHDEKQYNNGYKTATEYYKAKARIREIKGQIVEKLTYYQISEEVEKIELGGMYGAGFKQAIIDCNDSL